VLREVGYSVEEIDAMMAGRVTVEPPGTPAG